MGKVTKTARIEGCKLAALLAVFAVAVAQNTAAETGTSETTIAVDVRANDCRAVGQADIGYSPSWGGVTNAGAYVVLQKVVAGVTNTVATLAADAEDEYRYTFAEEASPFVRFIHRVYSSGGVEIGEPLVRDVAFGVRSGEGSAFMADSRANSLQEAVNADSPVNLTYSTAWATHAASVSVKAVQLSGTGGVPIATNVVFSAAADAEGLTAMRGVGRGWWRLLCEVSDGSGDTLLEYLTDEFKMKGGFTLTVR